MSNLLSAKKGLICGVANKRSLAWELPSRCPCRARNWH